MLLGLYKALNLQFECPLQGPWLISWFLPLCVSMHLWCLSVLQVQRMTQTLHDSFIMFLQAHRLPVLVLWNIILPLDLILS